MIGCLETLVCKGEQPLWNALQKFEALVNSFTLTSSRPVNFNDFTVQCFIYKKTVPLTKSVLFLTITGVRIFLAESRF